MPWSGFFNSNTLLRSKSALAFFIFIALGLCLTFCEKAAAKAAGPVLALPSHDAAIPLGPHLQIYEDPSGRLNVEQAASPAYAPLFAPMDSPSLSRGMTGNTVWIRFTLKNPPLAAGPYPWRTQWLLSIGQPTLMSVEAFTIKKAGALAKQANWQSIAPLSRFLNPIDNLGRFTVFRLPIGPNETRTFYLRVRARAGVLLYPRVLSQDSFLRRSAWEMVILCAYTGTILALAVYNLFIFISIRDRSYLWYVLCVVFMSLYFLGFNGIYQELPQYFSQWLKNNLPVLAIGAAYFCRGMFVRSFLMTGDTMPLIDKILVAYASANAVSAVCIGVPGISTWAGVTTAALGTGWPFMVIAAGLLSWVKGFKPAKFFLPATGIATMSGLVFILSLNGVIPFTDWNFHIQPIGYSIEAVMLSLALGYRINSLRQAKAGAEQALIQRGRQLRRLATELTVAEERERRAIAEDLHDSVTQNLATSLFSLRLLGRAMGGLGETKGELESICKLLDQTLSETRSLTFDISPPVLYDHGLAPALKWLAGRFKEQHGLEVEYIEEHRPSGLEENLKVTMFRAARELLVNVLKHSGCKKATLRVASSDGEVVIQVSDRGRGFDTDAEKTRRGGGFGLFSIRERLELLGGRMRVDSKSGRGVMVTVSAPKRADSDNV